MIPELLDVIRRRNKLKRLHNKSKNSTDRDRYKNQRNFTFSLRRKLISGYLRTTADNARGNPRTFWRVIKPFMHCRSNTSHDSIHLKEDNTLITDKSGVAEVFNKYFSSVLSDSDSTINRHSVVDYLSSSHQSISAIRTHCPVAQPFQFRHVTKPECEIILKSLEPKKVTGHDNIPPKALRTGAAVFAYLLSSLLNKIIDSGKVPTEWRLAEICPVFKKNDAQDKAMYRPVSILVVLDKVFEKCLERQLVQYFNPILSPSLSAYRRGYSCESVLLRLIEDWRFALDKKCVVGAVIMDLSKAFDIIPHNLLLAKLAAYGISSSSLVLLQDYLRGRSQRAKIEDVTSDVLPISKGVSQGSVLGPLFFNIFLNNLFYVIKRAKLSNYADDTQIYFCDRDPQVVKTVINDELALACKWFDDIKLVLNPTK